MQRKSVGAAFKSRRASSMERNRLRGRSKLRNLRTARQASAPADHALQLVRIATLDEVVGDPQDAASTGVIRASCRPTYFSCISFVTDFTPPTALATLTASLIPSRELTKPLN